MFYELIYTRCRHGIDILRKGQSIASDGYKVYGCSKEILEDESVDLQFLLNIAQSKQSYNDPSFMDDAFLFCVPDKGRPFLQNFHPIHFDPTIKGDFARRPGNYLNDVLIGDFEDIYPFELFNDTSIWRAKNKDEAYYYSTEEPYLPTREDIVSPPGQYTIDDIESFVANGRQEALSKAVSFLIDQYSLDYGQRKYLVITDESTENIELWIAAIEYAFSPRIASGLPFATRMDKFVTGNRYTVNQLGAFQTQINLQDPKQSLRYKAMIIGVNSNDKANANSARPLQNSPFVVLDGKNKTANFDAETSDPYFKAITKYDESHLQFCREFLNTFNLRTPAKDILLLHRAYRMLGNPAVLDARNLAEIVKFFKKFEVFPTRTLREIYDLANSMLPRLVSEDFTNALVVMDWIQKESALLGDTKVKEKLSDTVRNLFVETLYVKYRESNVTELWEIIKSSDFAETVVNAVISSQTIEAYADKIKTFGSLYAAEFFKVYVECCKKTQNYKSLKQVSAWCIGSCCRHSAKTDMRDIVRVLQNVFGEKTSVALLEIARESEHKVSQYIIDYLIAEDESIIASEKTTVNFCRTLVEQQMQEFASSVINRFISKLGTMSDLERFIKNVDGYEFLTESDIEEIYQKIDAKMGVPLKGGSSLAEFIQKNKHPSVICSNSAHVLAYDALSDKRRKESLKKTLTPYIKQGFPSTNDSTFIDGLMDRLFKSQFTENDLIFLTNMFVHAPKIYLQMYIGDVCVSASKQPDKWNAVILCCAKCEEPQLKSQARKVLVDVLVDTEQSSKSLDALEKIIDDKVLRRYFSSVADEAWQIIQSKPKSGLKKMFGFFKKD